MFYITENTKGSWWVPYEIGLANEKSKKIMSLKDKELFDYQLPEFIKIKPIIKKISELTKYFTIKK